MNIPMKRAQARMASGVAVTALLALGATGTAMATTVDLGFSASNTAQIFIAPYSLEYTFIIGGGAGGRLRWDNPASGRRGRHHRRHDL